MKKKVMAIGGVPGTGKSTLMKRFMKEVGEWNRIKPAKLLDSEFNEAYNVLILGKYDEDETFPGTDRMSMAVQPEAINFIHSPNEFTNVLYEGDRLFTGSFLHDLAEGDDVDLCILYLTTDKRMLKDRYAERGSDQSEQFLRSRQTKCENILCSFVLMPLIEEYKNENESDQTVIINRMKEFYSIP